MSNQVQPGIVIKYTEKDSGHQSFSVVMRALETGRLDLKTVAGPGGWWTTSPAVLGMWLASGRAEIVGEVMI